MPRKDQGYESGGEFVPSWPELSWEGSVGLTLGGGSGAEVTVTADGHGVGVEGIHTWGTPGQLHRHHPGLVVGADPVVGLDVRWLQDWFLQEKCKANIWSPRFLKGVLWK